MKKLIQKNSDLTNLIILSPKQLSHFSGGNECPDDCPCRIGNIAVIVAKPGTSNHERGIAIDVANYASV